MVRDYMIKSKIKLAVLASLLWPAFTMLSAQKLMTLDECIRVSLQKNLQVKNGTLDLRSVQAKIDEAKSGFLPSVDITGQYQYYLTVPKMLINAEFMGGTAGEYIEVSFNQEQTTTGSLQVTQSLYNQKVFIGLKAARVARNLSEFQLGKTKEDLAYNVSAVFYNLQMIASNLTEIDSNLVSLDRIRSVSRTLQANDLISKTNLKRLDISYENLKNERSNLLLTETKAYNLLKYLLGVSLDEKIEVVKLHSEEKSFVVLSDVDNVESRSDLLLIKEQISLAELDKKATLAEYYPSLGGVFNYSLTGSNSKFAPFKTIQNRWMKGQYVGLQLNIPVFSGFNRLQRVRQKEYEVLKARNNYELMHQSADKDLIDAKNNVLSTGNTFENASRNLDLAKDVFKSSTTEFQNGLISLTDILQIQNELTAARSAYSTALIQMKQAEMELKKSVGKLAEAY
jgi:outer membrane protein